MSCDNVLTEADIRIGCMAARSRCSRGVDTAGELLHPMDDIVESNISLCARIGPVPAVRSRQLSHSGLKQRIGEETRIQQSLTMVLQALSDS